MAQEAVEIDVEISRTWATIDQLVNGFLAFLPALVVGLIVFALFLLIAKLAQVSIAHATRRASGNLGVVLGRLAQWGLGLVGMLVAITIMAPSVRPVDLLSLLGIGGVAIGFAFKDILQNFLAGILILLRQPFRIGDQIVFKSYEGTVEEIATRATILRTYDGRRAVIPNGEIFTNAVLVNTAWDARRSDIVVPVGYGDDLRRATDAILSELAAAEGVLDEPPPAVVAEQFGGAAVELRVFWWTSPRQREVLAVRHRVLLAVRRRLAAEGVDIPFPTEVMLFHDQTEESDGDRRRQREGWPPGDDPPRPESLAKVMARRRPAKD